MIRDRTAYTGVCFTCGAEWNFVRSETAGQHGANGHVSHHRCECGSLDVAIVVDRRAQAGPYCRKQDSSEHGTPNSVSRLIGTVAA